MPAEPRHVLSPYVRAGISLAVVIHLLAVFLPPLAFQTRGPSGISAAVGPAMRVVEPYCQFLYIDRGYAFFAPDPGPSHLVQAAISSPDATTEVMFPDRQDQWPRLLYHRHFMITEYLEEIYQPPGPPPELADVDRAGAEYWARSRARYEYVRQSVVRHLQKRHPGSEVAIRRIEHLIPELADFRREPIALSDERMYRVLLDSPLEFNVSDEQPEPLAAPNEAPDEVRPESVPPPQTDPASAAAGSGRETNNE